MFYGIYSKLMNLNPSFSSLNKPDTANHASASTAGRRRARRALLAKSDRQLADMGFSRDLLEQGVKAWPWLVASDMTAQLSVSEPVAVVVPTVYHANIAMKKEHEVTEKQRYAA